MWGGEGDVVATDTRLGRSRRAQLIPQMRGVGAGASVVMPVAMPGESRLAEWTRRHGFVAELMLSCLVGVLFALAFGGVRLLPFLLVWAVSAFHAGRDTSSPLTRQLRLAVRSTLMPLALVALYAAVLGPTPAMVRGAMVVVVASAFVSTACRFVRWQVQSPIRTVVLGDRLALAQALARWQGQERVRPVAAIVMEPDLDETPSEIDGIPAFSGLDSARSVVERFRADMVVVSPGPGLTSTDLRSLSWSLQSTDASMAVFGPLHGVAPHRITPGHLYGATLLNVRAPRPSTFVQIVKRVLDPAIAAVLLVLTSPVLLAMTIAVRLDSKGPAIFRQTRVGRGGRHFTVYKMRTMVQNADEIRAELEHRNEADDVLFKIKDDPRITRVGAFLRRSSLDELPQLINVVRGEMSLVGPRPALPSEVAEMTRAARRRLAVRPGITGLWQVSGRSDLPWDRAVELDGYYADNWSLAGDTSILLRTVRAVMAAKGAY